MMVSARGLVLPKGSPSIRSTELRGDRSNGGRRQAVGLHSPVDSPVAEVQNLAAAAKKTRLRNLWSFKCKFGLALGIEFFFSFYRDIFSFNSHVEPVFQVLSPVFNRKLWNK